MSIEGTSDTLSIRTNGLIISALRIKQGGILVVLKTNSQKKRSLMHTVKDEELFSFVQKVRVIDSMRLKSGQILNSENVGFFDMDSEYLNGNKMDIFYKNGKHEEFNLSEIEMQNIAPVEMTTCSSIAMEIKKWFFRAKVAS